MSVKDIVQSIDALPFNSLDEVDNELLGKVYEQHMPEGLTIDTVRLNTAYRNEFHEAMVRSKIMTQLIEEAPRYAEEYGDVDITFSTPDVDFNLTVVGAGIPSGNKNFTVIPSARINVPQAINTNQACYDRLKDLWDAVSSKSTVTTD